MKKHDLFGLWKKVRGVFIVVRERVTDVTCSRIFLALGLELRERLGLHTRERENLLYCNFWLPRRIDNTRRCRPKSRTTYCIIGDLFAVVL